MSWPTRFPGPHGPLRPRRRRVRAVLAAIVAAIRRRRTGKDEPLHPDELGW